MAIVSVFASEPAAPDREALKAKYRRPAEVPSPKENPHTSARADLGKKLFFDPRLSGANSISCASCHNPAFSWSDGLAKGVTGGGLIHAFFDAPGSSSLTDLGDLGGGFSSALAVNSWGVAVGSSTDDNDVSRAFLWTPETGLRAITPASEQCVATGISEQMSEVLNRMGGPGNPAVPSGDSPLGTWQHRKHLVGTAPPTCSAGPWPT